MVANPCIVRQILDASDFSAWEEVTKATLGHHRSLLRSPSSSFNASFRLGDAGPLQLLHIEGTGELELDREQCGQAVVWIPLKGIHEERVNGQCLVIGPGQALLMRPGDHLLGRTAPVIEGVSLLLPANFASALAKGPPSRSRLGSIEDQQHLASAALALLRAVEHHDPCRAIAGRELLESVEALAATLQEPQARWTLGQRRRWQLVVEASRWMEARLDQPFGIAEVATALQCPPRTLQDAFARELGRSPLAQARLLRLRALRSMLMDRSFEHTSIATLMGACGLLACGATARAYAACYGELPRASRARRAVG